MRVFLKYIFWLLSFVSLIIFYLLATRLGHNSLGCYAEYHYSQTTDNKIEILSLDMEKYPYVVAKIRINDGALLWLQGEVEGEAMQMNYHLKGKSFKWNDYVIPTPIELNGTTKGALSELLVEGEGHIFNGKTHFSFIDKPEQFENLKGKFTGVDSVELQRFFNYEEIIQGEMDIEVNFDYLKTYEKKGLAIVSMKKAKMPKVSGEVEFSLTTEINFKNLLHEFTGEIDSGIGKLHVGNGHYNRAADLIEADYALHINELSHFEEFLKHGYRGELNTVGSVSYERENLSFKGDSESYGGLLKYQYRNEYIDLDFKGVSLEKFLRQLSYPPLLSADVYGTASYDIKDESVLVNTVLKGTRFRRTKMTDKIRELTGVNILKDVYNNSLFTAGYQDSVLTSLLKIDNGVNHLYLKDTKMNSTTNEVKADFEVQIDGQEFVGRIYGTLDNPEVSLDMSKLIKYQMNKTIEGFFGQ